MQPWMIAAAALGGYLLGSIPFGLVVVRLAGLGDIRQIGSKSIGATNVLRTGRKDLALITLIGDAGKGGLAALLTWLAFRGQENHVTEILMCFAGLAAFMGHNYPVWLGFKGGKGFATFLGVLLALDWRLCLSACAVWLIMAAIFRFSSLSALTAAALAPLFAFWPWHSGHPVIIVVLVMAILIFIRHHQNIARLLKGEEPKIGAKKGVTRIEPTAAMRRDWLRLSRTEGVGAVTFEELIRRYGEATAALAALPELAQRGGRATTPKVPTIAEAEAEIAAGEALGARLLINRESAFPRLLAAVDAPPPLIWTLGDPALLSRPTLAIVGARNASAAGQRFAANLARALGGAGYVIISGLARGIDGAAHDAALPTGTAAVLGGGVNDIYPPQHDELYARIAAKGCLVSESPIGHTAQARDFPRRNRLISGLSLGVIVVEAELRSGSLITARLAGEQGREVFAVPGSPLDPRAAGTNDLIRQGATLCAGPDDVLRVLETMRRFDEPPADWDGRPIPPDPEADPALREHIAELLSAAPVGRDELVRITGGTPAEVAAALVELALAGRAELQSGGMVVRG